jgi:hypothetical protein
MVESLLAGETKETGEKRVNNISSLKYKKQSSRH